MLDVTVPSSLVRVAGPRTSSIILVASQFSPCLSPRICPCYLIFAVVLAETSVSCVVAPDYLTYLVLAGVFVGLRPFILDAKWFFDPHEKIDLLSHPARGGGLVSGLVKYLSVY